MKTQKVYGRARNALVMVVVAAAMLTLSAAPAFAGPGVVMDDDRLEAVQGLYDSEVLQRVIEAAEQVEPIPQPEIRDGGDWEMGPEQPAVDEGAVDDGDQPAFDGGGQDVVDYPGEDGSQTTSETPEVPQGGNEETPTVPQGGQDETPTVPQGGNEETPTTSNKPSGGSLPFTGGNGTGLAVMGLALILGGIAVMALRREPETHK